jgi:hypothetical protein
MALVPDVISSTDYQKIESIGANLSDLGSKISAANRVTSVSLSSGLVWDRESKYTANNTPGGQDVYSYAKFATLTTSNGSTYKIAGSSPCAVIYTQSGSPSEDDKKKCSAYANPSSTRTSSTSSSSKNTTTPAARPTAAAASTAVAPPAVAVPPAAPTTPALLHQQQLLLPQLLLLVVFLHLAYLVL